MSYVYHISGYNYVIKPCPIIICHAWRIFFGGGRKIGVHDGYIHRFTGLKFLWITRLEPCSVKRNYLLGDKLTLSLVCPLTVLNLSSCVLREQEVNIEWMRWPLSHSAEHCGLLKTRLYQGAKDCGLLKAKLKTTAKSQIFLPFFYI